MSSRGLCTAIFLVSLSCISFAQGPTPPPPPDGPVGMVGGVPVPAPPPVRGLGRGMFLNTGRWWKDADVVQKLKLSDAQVKQMEQVFQDHRLKLIDLHAALEREEVRLEPMIKSDNPNENQVLAQIDKVAAQRANLEKANAQMAFSIRRILTPEQWKSLQTLKAEYQARGRQNLQKNWRGPRPRVPRHSQTGPAQPRPAQPQAAPQQ